MENINYQMQDLEKFITENHKKITQKHKENYDFPLSLNNIDFWETVLKLNIIL